MKAFYMSALLSLLPLSSLYAAGKPISGTLSSLPPSGTKLLAVSDDGKSSTVVLTKKAFSIAPPGTTARLYLLRNGKITGQLVLAKCSTTKTCSKTQVYTSFKAGKNLGALSKSGLVYVVKSKTLGSVVSSVKTTATSFVPVGLATTGLPPVSNVRATMSLVTRATTGPDVDGDGLIEALDADDNNNGVIDNYDSAAVTQATNSFRVFSNLKLEVDQSLNLHATGSLPAVQIDAAFDAVQTLAIQVAGAAGETTELDCGGLLYCSAGGTGKAPPENGTAFPGVAGASFDPDGDGFGTITKGATGDFQLATHATSTSITGGDTFIERISAVDGTERQVPGVLNFVFVSTPALQSIAINSDPAQTIDYTIPTGRVGSIRNCITVPATGSVSVTLVGWRPQRPGVSSAGEAAYVDIGNSLISIDIPNGPASLTPGAPSGGSRGPGLCETRFFSESDPNLSIGAEGIQDNKGDIDASSSNTYQFTADITGCLAAARGGAITWNANELLQLEVQFRSRDGDNASQRFCLKRAVS